VIADVAGLSGTSSFGPSFALAGVAVEGSAVAGAADAIGVALAAPGVEGAVGDGDWMVPVTAFAADVAGSAGEGVAAATVGAAGTDFFDSLHALSSANTTSSQIRAVGNGLRCLSDT
jgi:hypothetical protein